MDGMRGIAPTRGHDESARCQRNEKGHRFQRRPDDASCNCSHVVAGAPVRAKSLPDFSGAAVRRLPARRRFHCSRRSSKPLTAASRFFRRALRTYAKPVLMARGVVVGIAAAIALSVNLPALPTSQRVAFGLVAGALVYAGVSALRDLIYGLRNCGGWKSWRVYWWKEGWARFVGAAFAFLFRQHANSRRAGQAQSLQHVWAEAGDE